VVQYPTERGQRNLSVSENSTPIKPRNVAFDSVQRGKRPDRFWDPSNLLFNGYGGGGGAIFLGVRLQGCEADQRLPSSAKMKKAGRYTSTSSSIFTQQCLVKHFFFWQRSVGVNIFLTMVSGLLGDGYVLNKPLLHDVE
jgi:hypothetical protein